MSEDDVSTVTQGTNSYLTDRNNFYCEVDEIEHIFWRGILSPEEIAKRVAELINRMDTEMSTVASDNDNSPTQSLSG